MLEANYRSHAALLEVPSELFYGGKLSESGDRAVTHSMLAWEGLDNGTSSSSNSNSNSTAAPEALAVGSAKGRPLYFFGVEGVDMAELDSPSYFNLVEAAALVDLVQKLLTSSKVKVHTGEVGVIAAFRRQVLKLRKLLRERGMGNVNVGQVRWKGRMSE